MPFLEVGVHSITKILTPSPPKCANALYSLHWGAVSSNSVGLIPSPEHTGAHQQHGRDRCGEQDEYRDQHFVDNRALFQCRRDEYRGEQYAARAQGTAHCRGMDAGIEIVQAQQSE